MMYLHNVKYKYVYFFSPDYENNIDPWGKCLFMIFNIILPKILAKNVLINYKSC
jgi:hypothetical protein